MASNCGQNSNRRQCHFEDRYFGRRLRRPDLDEAAAAGAALVEGGGFHYAVTPNPEFLLTARHDEPFRQALLGADLVLADGVGVTYAAKILGRPLKGRVPGIEFAQRLAAWMAAHGKRLFLLGAKPAWPSWPPPI